MDVADFLEGLIVRERAARERVVRGHDGARSKKVGWRKGWPRERIF